MTQQTRHSDVVWATIRDDYLAGATQERLSEHYVVGVSTIKDRARREGWRRADQPRANVPPLDAAERDDLDEAEAMRPILWSIAEAYRKADVALRRGRAIEAQRFLTVARGFERLWRDESPLGAALNAHWVGQAEAWTLRRATPPWPHGVHTVRQAQAELPLVEAEFAAALAAGETDMDALAALIERRDRLRTCLDLIDEDWADSTPAEPQARAGAPDPPCPPCESDRAEPPLETKSAAPSRPTTSLPLGGRDRGWARREAPRQVHPGPAEPPPTQSSRSDFAVAARLSPRDHPRPLPPSGRGAPMQPRPTHESVGRLADSPKRAEPWRDLE